MSMFDFLSRRSAIKSLGAAVGSVFGGGHVSAQRFDADAFALVGDRWHSFDFIRTAFNRNFVDGMGLSLDMTSDYTRFNYDTFNRHRLLIVLMDGMVFPDGYTSPYHLIAKDIELISDPPVENLSSKHIMWINEEQGRDLKRWVSEGGSALFYHNASYISTANDDFRDVEGALFVGHTDFRPHRLEVVAPDHPITQGVSDFTITEEQHYVIYDKDPKHVFLRSRNIEGKDYEHREHGNRGPTCEAGWAYDYGKGRVAFMTMGHTIPGLWNPESAKLQQNAVRWLMREI
jgi:type 1 glutamine amidotransferase